MQADMNGRPAWSYPSEELLQEARLGHAEIESTPTVEEIVFPYQPIRPDCETLRLAKLGRFEMEQAARKM